MRTAWQGLWMTAAATMLAAAPAHADPLPGRDVLKFSQQPMVATPIPDATGQVVDYFGHDELSTAYSVGPEPGVITGYQGVYMADDFADTFADPVVHVRWWGSYLNDEIIQPVDKFLISFESDVPAEVNRPFSHPGQPLLNQVVTKAAALAPGSGTYTERLVRGPDPVVGESLYEYNAELHLDKPFPQEPDTVYWLKIVALVDVEESTQERTRWGWHNRDYTVPNPLASPNVAPGERVVGAIGDGVPIWHFQDDAVTGTLAVDVTQNPIMPEVFQEQDWQPTFYLDLADGPDGISQYSKDLAFELYTIPEPAAAALLLAGGLVMLGRRRQC